MPEERDHIGNLYAEVGAVKSDVAVLKSELHGIGRNVELLLARTESELHEKRDGLHLAQRAPEGETDWLKIIAIGLVLVGGAFTFYDRDISYFRQVTDDELTTQGRRIESLDTRSDKREHLVETARDLRSELRALEKRVDAGDRESSYQRGYLAGLKDGGG